MSDNTSGAVLNVTVATKNGANAVFTLAPNQAAKLESHGIRLEVLPGESSEVTVHPPAGDRLDRVAYSISQGLRNYWQVVVPDSGRDYVDSLQLIYFWGRHRQSRASTIRMPVFIFTLPDDQAGLVFGVFGSNIEMQFSCRQPAINRALVAWSKRLEVEALVGGEAGVITESALNPDGSLTQFVYFRDENSLKETNWHGALAGFSDEMSRRLGVQPASNPPSLLPFWCSWTDWFSGDVTHKVIMDNVREGVRLGIKNYIIDDGWFGPGLDSDFDVKLNIGDWSEEKSRIPDLRKLVDEIHSAGANAIIWCAPHAVSPDSNAFASHHWLLIRGEDGYMTTSNLFHSLCFRSPRAREVMADICVDLINKYGVDGAKYVLSNCGVKDDCRSDEHDHDTPSMVEGLHKTLELIDRKTRSIKPDYIIELKQNYATPHLMNYGTLVRAGDTPYDPRGNFLRTAYIHAYTPYTLNDYQSITNSDTPAQAAAMVIRMMAVGVPSYSMDLPALRESHKRILRFFHEWLERNPQWNHCRRQAVCDDLECWRGSIDNKDIYFVLKMKAPLDLSDGRSCQIIYGGFDDKLVLRLGESRKATVSYASPVAPAREDVVVAGPTATIDVQTGDVIDVRFQ